MEKIENFLAKYFWLVIILLCVPTFWALLVPGFYGASDDIHIAWLYEMHKTLLSGKIPPRFVPDLSFGFGYPLFNFVFPLPFYIAEIFHVLGLSLVDSIKLLFFLTIPLSGIFMYLLLRHFAGVLISLAGAILYIYTPYRSVDIYIRGAIGEIVSFTILPFVLLSVIKIIKDKEFEWRWVGLGGISLASLALSHNITAYMFFPFILLLIGMLISISSKKAKATLRIFLTFFLGFLISLYFWLPAILESNLLKYDTVFNFVDHFPTIKQLITPYWGYGASVPGPFDGMSFFLGFVNIVVIILGIGIFIIYQSKFTKIKKVLMIWAVICLLSAIFLMNYRSTPLWQNILFLPYFQFPWRFLILTTLVVPILIISFEVLKLRKFLAMAVIILAIMPTASYFRPEHFLARDDGYYINRYIPIPVASSEYLTTQEEYLRLTKYTKIRPQTNYPLVSPTENIVNITSENSLDITLEIDLKKDQTISYNKYYFPGWEAKVDGEKWEIFSGEPFGQISILVPAGYHKVEILFNETLFKKFINTVSLVSLIVSLLLINNFKLLKFKI